MVDRSLILRKIERAETAVAIMRIHEVRVEEKWEKV